MNSVTVYEHMIYFIKNSLRLKEPWGIEIGIKCNVSAPVRDTTCSKEMSAGCEKKCKRVLVTPRT